MVNIGPSNDAGLSFRRDAARSLSHGADELIQFWSSDCLSLDIAWISTGHRPARFRWNAKGRIGILILAESHLGCDLAPVPSTDAQTDSDLAAVLASYEELDWRCLRPLQGIFSGLIIDLERERLLLFNDRYGLGRIYYHRDGHHFACSTEAKCLLAGYPDTRVVDQKGLAELVSFGCVLQNRSLFKGIFLLPPGAAWQFEGGRLQTRQYFTPSEWEQLEAISPGDYIEQLTAVFSRAVSSLRPDGSAAISLTGGLDSRMLLAWITAAPGELPCYTFGGPYRDCYDVCIARRLAAAASQPHTTIKIQSDFFPEFIRLAQQTVYLSDGTMDVSGAIELYANRIARQIAPVRLTGNYGSEILRGNVAFRPVKVSCGIFTPEFEHLIKEAEDTYETERRTTTQSFIAFKQLPWHHFGRQSVERSQLTPLSPFLDNHLVRLAFQTPSVLQGSAGPLFHLIHAGNPTLAGIPTDRALVGHPGRLDGWARKWRDLTAKAEYAFDYGMPHWLAQVDGAMRPFHLERAFLGRHKFYHFRLWYRDQLRDTLRTLGEMAAKLPYYKPGAVQRMIERHASGQGNHTLDLHKTLSLTFIDQLARERQ